MEEFIAAVKALSNPDPSHIAQANLFLMNLAEQPAAWNISFQVLSRDAGVSTDVNCLYIAASMLYSKIRKEWRQLNKEEKVEIFTSLVRLVKNGSVVPDCNVQSLSQSPKPPIRINHTPLMPDIIQNRLYLSLAFIAVKVDDGPKSFVRVAFEIGGIEQNLYMGTTYSSIPLTTYNHRMSVMLQMLSVFPEEVESADCSHAWRTHLTSEVRTFFPHIMKSFDWVIGSALLSGQEAGQLNAVEGLKISLRCFTNWLDLGGVGLKEMGIGYPNLLGNLLNLMSGESVSWMASAEVALPVIASACLALERMCAIGTSDEVVNQYPISSGVMNEAVVDDAFVDALLKLSSVLHLAYNQRHEKTCCAIADVLTTFAIMKMDLIVQGNEKYLLLLEFILVLASRPTRPASIISLDFWFHFQHTPTSDRKYRVYGQLLLALVASCQYPDGFLDWTKQDKTFLDEDDFWGFREGVRDVIMVTRQVLDGARFLQVLMKNLEGGSLTWQELEVRILLLIYVADVYKLWMKTYPSLPDVLYSRQSIQCLISEVTSMNSTSLVASHVLLQQAGHTLIGCFAMELISLVQEEHYSFLLAQCLKYVVEGLKEPPCQHQASLAFRQICICSEGGVIFSTPSEIEALLMTLEMARSSTLPIKDRLLVAEAITRLTVKLVENRQAFCLILRFTSPILNIIKEEAISERPNLQFLRDGLQEFAHVVKFLNVLVPTSEQEHVLVDLLGRTWPLLEHVLQRFRGDEETVTEVFNVVGRILSSLGILLLKHVGATAFLKMISDCYFERFYPCCLDCMSVAVGIFVNSATTKTKQHFRVFLGHVNHQIFCHIQSIQLSGAQVLIKSLFDLYCQYLLFCGEVLMEDLELSNIIEFGVYCLGNTENFECDSIRSVLSFITNLICLSAGRLQQFEEKIKAVVFAKGSWIVYLIMKTLTGSSNSLLWSNLIDCLYTILKEISGDDGQHWLHKAFTQQPDVMSSEEVLHAAKCAFRMLHQGKRWFKAILVDFIKITRLEQMPDVLLAYDMM